MTGPLATRDRCFCLCHDKMGVPRWVPGGCIECVLVHPPGEMAVVAGDEPDEAEGPSPAEVHEALALVARLEELP